MLRAIISTTIFALLLLGCDEGANDLEGSDRRRGARGGAGSDDSDQAAGGDGVGTGGDGTDPDGMAAGACAPGVPHVGFAGTDLNAGRKTAEAGDDRRRVKPFTAMRGEFQRAVGNVPAGLAASAAAFGEQPARWYSEPTAGAVSLYTTYTLAFSACYDSMSASQYQAAPTATSAEAECTSLQKKVWQRTPSPDEVKACADVATGLSNEPIARRRWAHACASVMTSTGFTTY